MRCGREVSAPKMAAVEPRLPRRAGAGAGGGGRGGRCGPCDRCGRWGGGGWRVSCSFLPSPPSGIQSGREAGAGAGADQEAAERPGRVAGKRLGAGGLWPCRGQGRVWGERLPLLPHLPRGGLCLWRIF